MLSPLQTVLYELVFRMAHSPPGSLSHRGQDRNWLVVGRHFVGELQPSSPSAHDTTPPDPCAPGTLRLVYGRAALSVLDVPDPLAL